MLDFQWAHPAFCAIGGNKLSLIPAPHVVVAAGLCVLWGVLLLGIFYFHHPIMDEHFGPVIRALIGPSPQPSTAETLPVHNNRSTAV